MFFGNDSTIAHVHVNWLAPVKVRRTLLGGSRKMVVYDDLEPSEKIKVYDRGVDVADDPDRVSEILLSYRVGDLWAPNLPIREPLQNVVRHMLDCVETGATPLTDGLAGLRVVRVIEAATSSMRMRGAPVEIARD
jgi:predicted dehydrogenase